MAVTTPDNPDDGLPEITGDVTISGNGSTIRRDPDATESFRIFHVVSGGTLTLKSLMVSGGVSSNFGGGIRNVNASTLNLKSTTLRDNIAVRGAGLSNLSTTAGTATATLVDSLVTRNTAITAGGGIDNQSGGQVTLTNTKVIDNTPDNCAPEGSVPGCTNPTTTIDPPPTQELLPDDDIKDPE
ncbi:hypothetical protein [Streptomyces sp. MK37H]|uniref:hypothetical protein n=1 Tax=Streptomyces sp. MK37H TaxID=2699117 RepID=UPI001B378BDA|nr:hypothetical protein [Streptomyces sp. MK37H]MBP8533144.1 hypothetical protein [Streptomyces sp. MK37H]